jgi:hypothetical protein
MTKLGARAKLRQFFMENVGKVLDSKTLKSVAGDASEWARRIRELRNEEGLNIQTHNDRSASGRLHSEFEDTCGRQHNSRS